MDLLKILTRIDKGTDWIPFKNRIRPFMMRTLVDPFKTNVKNKRFKADGLEVLLQGGKALDSINAHFWLDFGTLLGIIRDGKLIKHDIDIDVGMFLKDHSPKIREAFEAHGFSFLRKWEVEGNVGLEEAFIYKGINFDIFYYDKDEEDMWCHLFVEEKDRQYSAVELKMKHTGFKNLSFAGQEWKVPQDPDRRLKDTYGENYMIPDPTFNTLKDAFNSRKLDTKVIYTANDPSKY